MELVPWWTFVAVLAVLAAWAPPISSRIDVSCFTVDQSGEVTVSEVSLYSHRLPNHIEPTHYKISLELTGFSVYSGPLDIFSFDGLVSMRVKFLGGNRRSAVTRYMYKPMGPGRSNAKWHHLSPAKNVVMHADDSLEIRYLRVYTSLSEGERQPKEKRLKIKKILVDRERQMIVLRMVKNLPVGQVFVIKFKYSGRTSLERHGLFVTGFHDRGTIYPQLVAKFRPTSARLVLPCFDEPSFKARFSLTLRHRAQFRALANTDLARPTEPREVVVSMFQETPPMPIHMVAFALAEFSIDPLTRAIRRGLHVRIFTMPAFRREGELALEVAAKATIWFEKLIDVSFPLKKLDLVAIGDMDTDNSEAWGLAFVKHNLLLCHEAWSTADSLIRMALNVAHVVVHQWFGGLATAEWWSDMWITEMFAAQMAIEFMATEQTVYQSEYFVRISTLSDALSKDNLSEGHALAPSEDQLSSSDGVSVLFDSITFMKSAALARLLLKSIGRRLFLATLVTIVKNHRNNVNLDKLIRAISSRNTRNADLKRVKRLLESWSTLVSYPVINVDLNGDTNALIMYQEPFYEAIEQVLTYPRPLSFKNYVDIPLEILIYDSRGNQITTEHVHFNVGEAGIVKTLPEWFTPSQHHIKVSPNPDISTYYRIRYSDDLLKLLHAPIGWKQMQPIERLHILNDANALVNSQLLKTGTFKELLKCYNREDDWALIIQMLIAAETLSRLAPNDSRPSSVGHVFKRIFEKSGFGVHGDENLLEQIAREKTLKALVDQNDGEVIEAGLRAFERQADNGANMAGLAVFLRDPVYAAVVKAGSQRQQLKLVDHMDNTNSYEERLRLAKNLVLTGDRHVAAKLALSLDRSGFGESVLQELVAANPFMEIRGEQLVTLKYDR